LSPVHNEILGPAQYRGKYPIGHGGLLLRIPLLAPGLRKYIERPPFSFADDNVVSGAGLPTDVRVELQHWCAASMSSSASLASACCLPTCNHRFELSLDLSRFFPAVGTFC
jgi:hypothetical protein